MLLVLTLALLQVDPRAAFDCLKFFPEFPPFKVLVAVVVVVVVVAPATTVAGNFEAKYAWALVYLWNIYSLLYSSEGGSRVWFCLNPC